MTEERMRPDRFAAILEAYGAEPRRWPPGERRAALEHLLTSQEARRLREEAARLDGLLDTLPPVRPSAALRERILADAPVRASAGQRRIMTGALAASLLLGFVAGATLQAPAGTREGGDFLQFAQLDDGYQDF